MAEVDESLLHEGMAQEVPLNKTSKVWPLKATYHQHPNPPSDDSFSTLGQRIIDGVTEWEDDLQFTGEFQYVKGYWEWTEDVLSRCEHKLKSARIHDSVYASLFTYDRNSNIMKAFLEAWCPSTNTLLTNLGELSISLWDLHILAGLPMTGSLYDEVTPNVEELTGVDEANSIFLPISWQYLFRAYHLLQKSEDGDQSFQVSVESWIAFWSKKDVKYQQPPPRKEKKTVCPKLTHNPLGDFGIHEEWSTAEEESFTKFEIGRKHREETYLAVFLACWLCSFVLSVENIGSIRPSTFKMASIMASGRRMSLAIPVLASIYKGLNEISSSSRPGYIKSSFPAHFVYGWLAFYFKTHYQVWQRTSGPKMTLYSGEWGAKYFEPREARKRIHKGDFVSWTCTMITKGKDFLYVDNGNAEDFEQDYYIAIRSNYLPLRRGEHFIVEPYSPHRFSRQFGYYQEIPGVLTHDIRKITLDDGIRYWRLCTLSKSMSKTQLPSMPRNAEKFSSEDYKKWWEKVHSNYFEKNIKSLINPKSDTLMEGEENDKEGDPFNKEAYSPPGESKRKSHFHHLEESGSSNVDHHWKRQRKDFKSSKPRNNSTINPSSIEVFVKELEKEILDIDDDDELQDSQGSAVGLNSLNIIIPNAETTRNKEVSLPKTKEPPHHAMALVFKGEKFLLNHQKEFLKKLWGDLRQRIADISIDSISSIQDDVQFVLESMRSFNKFDISQLKKLLKALFDKANAYDEARSTSSEKTSKELLAQRLGKAKDRLHNAQTREVKEANQIRSTEEELKSFEKELENLKERRKNLCASLKRQQQLLQSAQVEVHEIEEEITAIENDLPSSDEAMENLKTVAAYLEASKEELKSLDPFA